MEQQRPTSVTVVCWILIAIAVISLLATIRVFYIPEAVEVMKQSPLPIPVQYGITILGLAITLASAIAMLKGKKWGRTVYVIWSVVGFAIGIVTSPIKAAMIPGLVIFVILVFFLFRPKANAYFR